MADIVLINPKFEASFWGLEYALDLLGVKANLPVAALPLLAALTPAEHRIELIDENVEPIDYGRCARADIVGVTGMSVQRFRMREIIAELKRRGCFVVVGGPWVTVQEDYFDPEADAIFVGEAEMTWPQFLSDWSAGRPTRRYEQLQRTDVTQLPVPRHDLLNMSDYAFGSVQFSRGCPFTCEFCDIIVTFGRKPRLKTSRQIIAELDSLWRRHRVTKVFIVDDNLIGNKKETKAILRDLLAWQQQNSFPLLFFTQASIDLADDPELLALMSAVNIRIVFVGVETPNEASLRETKKLQNLRAGGSLVEKIHRIQAAGLEVWSGQIIGFDHDGLDIFDRQVAFLQEARIITSMVGMLSAIPKTPLHTRLAREGRLDEADRPVNGTNVIPLQLDRDQLSQGYLRVMQTIYAPEAYFERVKQLYLQGPLGTLEHWPERSWLDALRQNGTALMQAAFIVLRLETRVRDRALRRVYRTMIGEALRRHSPLLLHILAMKCAMHYHAIRLVRDMAASRMPVNTF
ncbi:B12-binding domain-containing radical SAM protein [Microvirga yunnanensis]|uniref:B12-binding domain-containing radical SAM protein n=1 Tax=Microvirga yunnanensis TaxID=2953740 RepID=UPI0021CA5E9B|nr:B12-binding domain-containing radical SAM protein [Microvirga sp. HBU65207]